jgi:diacylglycerol kinase family enzyme
MHGNVERLPIRQNTVAVLLNGNAKAVTERLRRDLEHFVPPEDLFFSRTLEDARSIARTVLDRGYSTVLTGGGDGTFVGYLNCILEEATRLPPRVIVEGSTVRLAAADVPRIPRFGVLKLGTGNAVAEFAGSSPRHLGVVEDILRTRSGEVRRAHALDLVECDGKRAPFAGLGVDAAVLNDYMGLKSRLAGGKLQFAGAGGLGYFWSIAGRTIPAFLAQRRVPNVEIVNLGAPARQIGPDGKPLGGDIARGEILYRGPCHLVASGTVPCYGFGFRMFPFARKAPGRFQLRLSAMGLARMIAVAPRMWRGQTPRAGVLDFHCQRVRIAFDCEMPLQIGGDAEGYRRDVVIGMSDQSLELLDFNRAPASA